MCLGVPGKIVEIYDSGGLMMGKIDFGGVTREACLAYVPEAKVGDYTLIHVGFALNLISEEDAQETLTLLREIAQFEEQAAEPATGLNREGLVAGPGMDGDE
jgi:hydrogenase expression/formation protein HypC